MKYIRGMRNKMSKAPSYNPSRVNAEISEENFSQNVTRTENMDQKNINNAQRLVALLGGIANDQLQTLMGANQNFSAQIFAGLDLLIQQSILTRDNAVAVIQAGAGAEDRANELTIQHQREEAENGRPIPYYSSPDVSDDESDVEEVRRPATSPTSLLNVSIFSSNRGQERKPHDYQPESKLQKQQDPLNPVFREHKDFQPEAFALDIVNHFQGYQNGDDSDVSSSHSDREDEDDGRDFDYDDERRAANAPVNSDVEDDDVPMPDVDSDGDIIIAPSRRSP